MKDFYDIYYLSRTFDFDGMKLQSAVFETLQRRETPYDKDSFEHVITLADNEDIKKRWRYFLRTIKDDTLEFSFVITEIKTFLEPVFNAIAGESVWQKKWFCRELKWLQFIYIENKACADIRRRLHNWFNSYQIQD